MGQLVFIYVHSLAPVASMLMKYINVHMYREIAKSSLVHLACVYELQLKDAVRRIRNPDDASASTRGNKILRLRDLNGYIASCMNV